MPRDNLFRALFAGERVRAVELRAEDGDQGDGRTMVGHFAVFNVWTEINSFFEGNFMERFASGSFKKTIREQRDRMRVLFQHGRDPIVGDKPLGPIEELAEDDVGPAYKVPLLRAAYVDDHVLPGLAAGLYGASFRFRVMKEEVVEEPGTSDHNPKGLPERTVKEAQVMEFGPVTFPAYAEASAGVRSLTDDFWLPAPREIAQRLRDEEPPHSPPAEPEPETVEPTVAVATRSSDGSRRTRDYLSTNDDKPRWWL